MQKRQLRPTFDRVLVKLKPTDKKIGMIEIPDQYIERNQMATQEAYVVKIGMDAFKQLGSGDEDIKVGDLVKILKYSGDDDKTIDDECVYRIISDSDILGVFDGESLND